MDDKMRAAFSNNETPKKAPRRFIKRKAPTASQPAAKKASPETKLDKSDPDFYLFNSSVSEKEKEFIRSSGYVYSDDIDNKNDKKEVKRCPRCHELNNCPDDYCFVMDMEGKWVNPMILDLH